MREFFGVWRRKLGMLTLLIACALAAGWVRSYSASDVVRIARFDSTMHLVRSVRNSLIWERLDGLGPKLGSNSQIWSSGKVLSLDDEQTRQRIVDRGQERFRWNGFEIIDFVETQDRGVSEPPAISRTTYWVVPYWSLVLPPTLLSAYLLLSKQRRGKPSSSN